MFTSRNPFLSRSHSLGILLLYPCLRDPCALVPQSGDPSVWEEAFGLGSFFGLLSVSCGPSVGFSPKDPFLEFHQPQRVTGLFVSKACLCKDLGLHPPALHPPPHTHTGRSSQQRSQGLADAQLWSGLARSGQNPPLCRPTRISPRGQLGRVWSSRPHSPPHPRLPETAVWAGYWHSQREAVVEGDWGGDGWGHAHSSSLFQPTPSPLRGLLLHFPKPFPESQSKPGPGEGLGSPGRKKMLPRLPPGLKGKTHRGKEMGCSKQEPQSCGL